MGFAHSVEVYAGQRGTGRRVVWCDGTRFVCRESIVQPSPQRQRAALAHLVERLRRRSFVLLDTQYLTPHLASMGAVEVSADTYNRLLKQALAVPARFA
ncbi:MAG: hypothetical protein R3C44_06355 [Chloroflexota bacterium]